MLSCRLPSTMLCGALGVLYLICINLAEAGVGGKSHWRYGNDPEHGPAHWPGYCNSGRHQSPVNIETPDAMIVCDYSPLHLSADWEKPIMNYTLVNTGHSLQVKSPYFRSMRLSGGGLEQTYDLEQFHFHWAEVNGNGSEHTIGDLHYPMEMHMVAVRRGSTVTHEVQLSNERSPLAAKDGLAVVSVLFSLTTDEDKVAPELKELVKIIEEHQQLLKTDGTASISHADEGFSLEVRGLLPLKLRAFYRYDGSLTTPNCNEIVTWTIMRHQHYITQNILDTFRKIRNSDDHAIHNYRPVQPLHERKMYYYTPRCQRSGKTDESISAGITVTRASVLMVTVLLPWLMRAATASL